MEEALWEVERSQQSTAMAEQRFSNELWKKELRCGTIFSGERIKDYFVESVLPSIRTKLRNYTTDHPRAEYESIFRYSRGLVSSYCALRRVSVLVSFLDSQNAKKVAFQKSYAFTVESDSD